MSAEEVLRLLALIDTAFATWEANGQDTADLLALRERLDGLSHEQKVAVLQERSQNLQDRADALRNA